MSQKAVILYNFELITKQSYNYLYTKTLNQTFILNAKLVALLRNIIIFQSYTFKYILNKFLSFS